MPIAVQTIIDRVTNTGLDAQGSDYYDDTLDYIPAINSAVDWLVSVIEFAKDRTKFPAELLRELNVVKVFQTSTYSRVKFDTSGTLPKVWSIENVYIELATDPAVPAPTSLTNPEDSIFETAISMVDAEFSCKQLTSEEWITAKKNPFVQGNETLQACGDLNSYAYKSYTDYTSSNYVIATFPSEIWIRPTLVNKLIAVEYIKVPTPATVVGDNLQFPEALQQLIVDKTLNIMARKQGDETTIYAITERDINTLLKAVL